MVVSNGTCRFPFMWCRAHGYPLAPQERVEELSCWNQPLGPEVFKVAPTTQCASAGSPWVHARAAGTGEELWCWKQPLRLKAFKPCA